MAFNLLVLATLLVAARATPVPEVASRASCTDVQLVIGMFSMAVWNSHSNKVCSSRHNRAWNLWADCWRSTLCSYCREIRELCNCFWLRCQRMTIILTLYIQDTNEYIVSCQFSLQLRITRCHWHSRSHCQPSISMPQTGLRPRGLLTRRRPYAQRHNQTERYPINKSQRLVTSYL